jgi:hypothetical protein
MAKVRVQAHLLLTLSGCVGSCLLQLRAEIAKYKHRLAEDQKARRDLEDMVFA